MEGMAQEAGTKLVGMGSPILGNKGTDEPKNTQIHKYTNTQIHTYKKLDGRWWMVMRLLGNKG